MDEYSKLPQGSIFDFLTPGDVFFLGATEMPDGSHADKRHVVIAVTPNEILYSLVTTSQPRQGFLIPAGTEPTFELDTCVQLHRVLNFEISTLQEFDRTNRLRKLGRLSNDTLNRLKSDLLSSKTIANGLKKIIRGEHDDSSTQCQQINVLAGSWDDSLIPEIQAVLNSVKCVLDRNYFDPTSSDFSIEVSKGSGDPMTFPKQQGEPWKVDLSSDDRFWSKFAYQFAHEYCHTRLGLSRAQFPKTYLWIDEIACEVSSILALELLAEEWKVNPPYPNWSSYAPNFLSYLLEHNFEEQNKAADSSIDLTDREAVLKAFKTNPELRAENHHFALKILDKARKKEFWQELFNLDIEQSYQKYIDEFLIVEPKPSNDDEDGGLTS